MSLRRSFRPLRPDLDGFLFANVGEIDENEVSVISALTRLELDPWEEADRLTFLSRREAAEQLARLTVEVPGISGSLIEARQIAERLVGLLPQHNSNCIPTPPARIRLSYRKPSNPSLFQLWVVFLVLAAAVLVSALVHGGLPFGIVSP